jgi:hypothetical protein
LNPFVVVPTLLAAALLALPQDPDAAQNGERLQRTLQATKLSFEKMPSGRSYKLTYGHERTASRSSTSASRRTGR